MIIVKVTVSNMPLLLGANYYLTLLNFATSFLTFVFFTEIILLVVQSTILQVLAIYLTYKNKYLCNELRAYLFCRKKISELHMCRVDYV